MISTTPVVRFKRDASGSVAIAQAILGRTNQTVVYSWEQATSEWFATMPQQGVMYEAMQHASDPGHLGWLIVFVVIALYCWKQRAITLLPLIVGLTAVGIGDLVARRIVKSLILRPRPHFIHQACDGSHCWGFVSSHFTNISAQVCVLCLFDKRRALWGVPLILLIALSRLYLLDHYPLDVIGGGLLGASIGISVFALAQMAIHFSFYAQFRARF